MEDGLLSLKWNNHRSTFFHILSGLRKKQTYTDATLACEGKYFPVHKLVMSTCSDYFGEIFEKTICKSPVVVLKDIGYHELEALLDYMYLGEVDVKQTDLASLIKAAECLRIKGLAVPDEDPSICPKRTSDRRLSPTSKRLRRDGDNVDSHRATKSSRASTPLSSRFQSQVNSTSSQSLNNEQSASYSPNTSPSQEHDSNPMQRIKVEMTEINEPVHPARRGTHFTTDDSRNSTDNLSPVEDEASTDHQRLKGSRNNSFSEYSNHPPEYVEKEECEQIENYNGSDQIAGPSGIPGSASVVAWGDEDNNFPQSIFTDESSHQQVDEGSLPLCQRMELFPHQTVGGGTIYQCPYCLKNFRDKSKWTCHCRTHTGERPFKCPYCEFSSARKTNMKRHTRNMHAQELWPNLRRSDRTQEQQQAQQQALQQKVEPVVVVVKRDETEITEITEMTKMTENDRQHDPGLERSVDSDVAQDSC